MQCGLAGGPEPPNLLATGLPQHSLPTCKQVRAKSLGLTAHYLIYRPAAHTRTNRYLSRKAVLTTDKRDDVKKAILTTNKRDDVKDDENDSDSPLGKA